MGVTSRLAAVDRGERQRPGGAGASLGCPVLLSAPADVVVLDAFNRDKDCVQIMLVQVLSAGDGGKHGAHPAS